MADSVERRPTCDDVLQCRFAAWYPKFRACTFPSEVIPLPADFVAYLREDGIHLPESVMPAAESSLSGWSTLASGAPLTPPFRIPDQSDSDDESSSSDSDSDDKAECSVTRFPELDERIDEALAGFGGAVFPKFTWSAPHDGTWLNENNSLKCTNALQIYLLLKGSDRVAFDLRSAFEQCSDHVETLTAAAADDQHRLRTSGGEAHFQHCLVLRQWYALNLGMEFRCFVRDGHLLAVSQRHDDMYFDYLRDAQAAAVALIKRFLADKVRPRWSLSSYVVDVYVDQKNRVWIVDFNPWSPRVVSSVLFTWDELHSWPASGEPHVRVIAEQGQIRPRQGHENRAPIDVVELATAAAVASS